MSGPKYELTTTTHPSAPWLRQIRALVDIPAADVVAGDLGGWVESLDNLSQDGSAWVSGALAVAA